MRRVHNTLSFPCVAVMVYSLTGCGLFHEYRPMRVLVRDAETKQPLPNVEIEGTNMAMLDVFGPSSPHGTTDANGVATLKIGPDRAFNLRVDEPGYEMTDHRKGDDYFNTLPKRGGLENDPKRIDLVMDLPRREGLTAVVTVPDDYRGLVRVQFKPTGRLGTPATHIIQAAADVSGRVVVPVPEGRSTPDVAAKYRNGKTVPWDGNSPNSERVALRLVESIPGSSLYLIGTGPEAEEYDKRLRKRHADGREEFDPAAYSQLFHEQ